MYKVHEESRGGKVRSRSVAGVFVACGVVFLPCVDPYRFLTLLQLFRLLLRLPLSCCCLGCPLCCALFISPKVPMLQHMGLAFEGREHSGLDDARNIARILIVLLESGHLEPHSF